MSLSGALSIASSGLGAVNQQFQLVSQNVANASTPDFATETSSTSSLAAGAVGLGAQSGAVQRVLDQQLQASLFTQNATVAGWQTQQSALQRIDAVQGTPGQANDLASLLGQVQGAFSSLNNNPSSVTQQQQVIASARALTSQLNALSSAVTTGRQQAQANLLSDVGTLNTSLARIGTLNQQIIQLQAQGQSTADLANQRDAARDQLSKLLNVSSLQQPNGNMLLMTPSGLMLPTTGGTPFATASVNPGPTSTYPSGGIPGITLGGMDVTAQLRGGSIGGNIALRDTTLPTIQAGLDEFAQTLTTRFANQGLQLFTDPTGIAPAPTGPNTQSGYVGYAAAIGVNPTVGATPSLVRDGTQAVAGFTPNPAGGPAGFNTLISNILTYAMGNQSQPGVSQPAPATTGLGPTGALSLGFTAPTDLPGFGAALETAQAQISSGANAAVSNETAVQTALQSRMSATSGVSMDTEMSHMIQLQNLYTANARLIGAIQSMWTQTLDMVTR